jgi:hypothetical protein
MNTLLGQWKTLSTFKLGLCKNIGAVALSVSVRIANRMVALPLRLSPGTLPAPGMSACHVIASKSLLSWPTAIRLVGAETWLVGAMICNVRPILERYFFASINSQMAEWLTVNSRIHKFPPGDPKIGTLASVRMSHSANPTISHSLYLSRQVSLHYSMITLRAGALRILALAITCRFQSAEPYQAIQTRRCVRTNIYIGPYDDNVKLVLAATNTTTVAKCCCCDDVPKYKSVVERDSLLEGGWWW